MRPFPPLPEPWTDGLVTLRPVHEDDVEDLVRACQDPEVQRYTLIPAGYGEQDALEYVTSTAERRATGASCEVAVADAATDVLVGCVGIVRVDELHGRGEIGYWVAPWARGRGVAVAALRLLCRWALTDVGLPRLEIVPYAENEGSQRVAERAGFTREGLLRSYFAGKDGRRDCVTYSLVAGDEAAA